MKRIVAVCLVLVFAGEWVREWAGSRTVEIETPVATSPWVRTVDGWEQLDTSPPPVVDAKPTMLHPAVVAAGMVLASLLALVAKHEEDTKIGQQLAVDRS